ncbi:pathogenesis-related protein PR-1-like [Magnolia sinica]|uniref:pathogenesis-related protein PR-1-like n=1 Tax=Magnolia sinica TaxID=86752 RepID=UPI00265AFFD5|nr:pathogenesis-related protein PR-1-like [Magnolia sinica]
MPPPPYVNPNQAHGQPHTNVGPKKQKKNIQTSTSLPTFKHYIYTEIRYIFHPIHSHSKPTFIHFSAMAPPTSFLLITLISLLSLLITAHASLNSTQIIAQFIDGHNSARRAVGVPPLKWEPLLARYARVYSNERRKDCALVHSPGYGFGENIFWGQGHRWTAKDAVDAWAAEKQFYHYSDNTCSSRDCSHYTQMVWRTTERVGCAQIICDSGDTFITCEYYPPGNYAGARPY